MGECCCPQGEGVFTSCLNMFCNCYPPSPPRYHRAVLVSSFNRRLSAPRALAAYSSIHVPSSILVMMMGIVNPSTPGVYMTTDNYCNASCATSNLWGAGVPNIAAQVR